MWETPGCCINPNWRKTISVFTAGRRSGVAHATEASYKEYLTLTQNRFNAGVASDLDVAQAESQLYGVQSQLVDLGRTARRV